MKKMFLLCVVFVITQFVATPSFAAQSIFDTSASSLFNNENEFLKPEQAFQFSFFQQENKLTINFHIAQGYYLYRNKFKFTGENVSFSPVELPIGVEHEDEFFGVQQIYQGGELEFLITLTEVNAQASISVRYQGCAEKGLCFPPEIQTIALTPLADNSDSANQAVLSALDDANSKTNIENTTNKSEQHQLADMLQSDSLLVTLVAFFLGGLLLAFTPCVFPMYPILTGIIVGQGDKLSSKKAFSLSFVYVQGMAITYTALGVVVALAGAQFQAMFQHPIILISLSVVFVLLALSMFGVFNLALPSSWQNKLTNLSNQQKGGSYFGVFIMGMVSGLVASPCTTAPLTGALLYISQSGDVILGASALYALSLGMGLPLLVLGSSGGKLLPKAGNWMTIIKNIFGLLLLAVPIFLIERLIDESIVEVLWGLLLLATGVYFFIANHHSKINVWFAIRSILIFIILFIGSQKIINVVLPEQTASVEDTHGAFIDVESLAQLLQQVSIANQQGKTVMVDLYADWCVACKEFEEYTFPKPDVKSALKNSVLLRVDLSETGSKNSKELMQHYQVFGLPSILFFDLNGNELTNQRVTGFMDAKPFAEHINAIFNN